MNVEYIRECGECHQEFEVSRQEMLLHMQNKQAPEDWMCASCDRELYARAGLALSAAQIAEHETHRWRLIQEWEESIKRWNSEVQNNHLSATSADLLIAEADRNITALEALNGKSRHE